MKKSEESFMELRKNVTSKGGVTFEALKVMEESNLEETLVTALEAAYKKTKELGK